MKTDSGRNENFFEQHTFFTQRKLWLDCAMNVKSYSSRQNRIRVHCHHQLSHCVFKSNMIVKFNYSSVVLASQLVTSRPTSEGKRAKEFTYLHDSLSISVSSKIKKSIYRNNSQSLTRRQAARSVVIAIFSSKKGGQAMACNDVIVLHKCKSFCFS